MRIRQVLFPLAFALGLAMIVFWSLTDFTVAKPVAGTAVHTVCPSGPPDCEYSTIQAAVDAADDGDIIKVAAGTYTDMHTRPRNDVFATGIVTQVVYINKPVTIRGGYTVPDFADPPNPAENITILDAQHQGRVVYVTGYISATLEGLQMTGGDAFRQGGYPLSGINDAGGGLYIISATVTLRNSQVFSNTAIEAGGGLLLYRTNATLEANTIRDNSVPGHAALGCCTGGGLYVYSSVVTLVGNEVSGNRAEDAGGLGIFVSNATLIGNTISGNVGSLNTCGGALFLGDGYDAILIRNTFEGNYGTHCAGLFIWGSNATLLENTFAGNTGPGAYLYLTNDAELIRNTFANNTAHRSGGGLILFGSTATLADNTITDNTTNGNGGGIWLLNSATTLTNNVIANNQAELHSGGLSIVNSSAQLLHSTIVSNTSGDGSGITIQESSSVSFTNTILVSHTVAISVAAGSTATLNGVLWFNNGMNFNGTGSITVSQAITGDPLLEIDGYHILSGSAAIDAGINAQVTTDIDQQPRPYLAPDLGADEYWPPGALKRAYLPLASKGH